MFITASKVPYYYCYLLYITTIAHITEQLHRGQVIYEVIDLSAWFFLKVHVHSNSKWMEIFLFFLEVNVNIT